jgi:hypothetical protein
MGRARNRRMDILEKEAVWRGWLGKQAFPV